jgi:hypothetical protein
MSDEPEFIIETSYTVDALREHPGLLKADLGDYLTHTVPSIGDGVSFVVDGKNADLVVLKRRFVYEPGRTSAQLLLGLAD